MTKKKTSGGGVDEMATVSLREQRSSGERKTLWKREHDGVCETAEKELGGDGFSSFGLGY